jgi:hypothetical protein
VRELHVVAMSEDGRHVVLATRKGAASGDFRVALDDRLAAAVRGDLPRPGDTPPAGITPKEIQARLRAGESPEEIAASAGVPLAKVERYARPVLSERERVLDQARAGFVSRSRLGESALPLGEAVDRHLADTTGVRLETVSWSTRREESGSWLVELSYVSQARRRSATWRYDVSRREVTATDAASAALAHVEPAGRRSRSAESAPASPAGGRSSARTAPRPAARRGSKAPAAKAAARKTPAAKAPAAKAAARKTPAAKAPAATALPARTVAARPTPASRAAADAARAAAAATKAAEARARAAEERAAQAAAEKAAAEKAAAAQAAAEKAAAEAAPPTAPPTLRVVGSDEPPDTAEAARREPKPPPAAARTTPARAAGQRASVPGWADVLLSTAPVARPVDPEPDAD